MWDKKWPYRWLLLLAIFLPTIIVLLLQLWFSIERPLFVYEYFLVGFLFSFNVRSVWPWFIFVFIFVLDLITIFSKLYLFHLTDFLNVLKYFSDYTTAPNQIILLIIVFFALFLLFFLFKIIKRKISLDKVSLRIFTVMLVITFTFDNINGSSIGLAYNPSLNFYKGNFAGTPTLHLYHGLINRSANENIPLLLPLNKESLTYKEYKSDTSSNQMLIIVESFGLINDSLKREMFQKDISYVFKSNNWNISWGKTPFNGSTTHAELRELLNYSGDFRYFLKPQHANNFNSIFQIKKKQDYNTISIHSYKANMFERAIWWKNIGADHVFFSEDVQFESNFQSKLNYESPFISVNDEDAFDFVHSKISPKGKYFVYFLTENAHLPFKGKPNTPGASNLFQIDKESNLSGEAKNQSKRITNFLVYVATHLDSNKFQKLLIVGDHMPPFLDKNDRSFYSDKFVPYCIITR
jgi:hypothetical protein